MIFDTISTATTSTIPSNESYVMAEGFSAVGDARETLLYKKVGTAPANHQLYFQSTDGAYWEYVHGPKGINASVSGMSRSASNNATAWAKLQLYAKYYLGNTRDIFIDVFIPPGTYSFGSQIIWDPSLGGIDGYGAYFNFNNNSNGILVQASNPEDGTPYRNARSIMRGLLIAGSTMETLYSTVGLNFAPSGSSSAHLSIRDCDIVGFRHGLDFSANAYLIDFDHCDIYFNAYGLTDNGNQANSGENINFNSCAIFNNAQSATALTNPNASYRFNNCSIDYNGETGGQQIVLGDTNAVFMGCHIEANAQQAVALQQYLPRAIHAKINFHGCTFIQQSSSGSTPFIDICDSGYVNMIGGVITIASPSTSPVIKVHAGGSLLTVGLQRDYGGSSFISADSSSFYKDLSPTLVP